MRTLNCYYMNECRFGRENRGGVYRNVFASWFVRDIISVFAGVFVVADNMGHQVGLNSTMDE